MGIISLARLNVIVMSNIFVYFSTHTGWGAVALVSSTILGYFVN